MCEECREARAEKEREETSEVDPDNDEEWRNYLDEDEKEQLIKAWELYLKNSEEVKISPSTMLLLTTGIIYAPRIILAMNERKEQRMKQQQAAQEQQ